jgi:hypothetical protein
MSIAINRQEGSELIIRSREAARRGNYAEAYRLIRDLPLTVRDLPEAVILKASLVLTARRYEADCCQSSESTRRNHVSNPLFV